MYCTIKFQKASADSGIAREKVAGSKMNGDVVDVVWNEEFNFPVTERNCTITIELFCLFDPTSDRSRHNNLHLGTTTVSLTELSDQMQHDLLLPFNSPLLGSDTKVAATMQWEKSLREKYADDIVRFSAEMERRRSKPFLPQPWFFCCVEERRSGGEGSIKVEDHGEYYDGGPANP